MIRALPILIIALFALGASAQTPAPAPAPDAEEASLHGYGDKAKACQEWTDTCRTCVRGDNGDPICPNIGIACQPKAISCTRRLDPPK
jgi:hypothetical protein